jgi:hypothetical protein
MIWKIGILAVVIIAIIMLVKYHNNCPGCQARLATLKTFFHPQSAGQAAFVNDQEGTK